MPSTGATIRILSPMATLAFLLTCTFASAYATDITVTLSGSSPYCATSSGTANYFSTGITFSVGNKFNVELSDAFGSFTSPTNIGSITSTAVAGSIAINFPAGASGAGYRVRVSSTNPVWTGTPGATITISQPVNPTISISASPSGTVGSGSSVYISSTTTNAGASPTYEWKRNGVVTGGNTNVLSLQDVTSNDIIVATLTSSGDCPVPASVASNTINLSVNANITETDHVWEQRASQLEIGNPIARSNAVGFVLMKSGVLKGYVGTGFVGTTSNPRKDFWEYDTATDTWTQVADFGGTPRYNAVAFIVNSKGYVGSGISSGSPTKDFWEYNPVTNIWTRQTDLPGNSREQAFAFTVGIKGYVGGGFSSTFGDLQDFYEYDGASWVTRTDVPTRRRGAAAFSIGSRGFIAGGYNAAGNTYYKDFWDYDPSGNAWTQRPDVPGSGRTQATGLSLGGNGYVGLGNTATGYNGEFYRYNLSTNSWTARPNFSGPSTTNSAVALAIGNRGFVFKDGVWTEFALMSTTSFPSKLCTGETIPISFDASNFVFSANNVFTTQISQNQNFSVATSLGTILSTSPTGTINSFIPSSANGTYYFRITSSNPALTTLLEVVTITNVPSTNTVTSEQGLSVCKDTQVTFKSNLTGSGFTWYKNGNLVGTDANSYVDNTLVNDDQIVSTRTYSTGCSTPVSVTSLPVKMTIKTPTKPVVTLTQPNTLSSSVANAYQWFLDNAAVTGANKQTYAMQSSGTYKVRITDNSGCIAFSDDIINAFTGLEPDPILSLVRTYPNPVAGEMILEVADELVSKGCDYSVFNELGQSVFGAQQASKVNKINFNGKSSGLYLVKLNVEGNTIIRRIVKVE